NIEQRDTLSKQFNQKPAYDVVLANPPFAGYVDKADLSDNFSLDTAKTELLFLELFFNLLAVGGKAAVIVPSGVLFSSSNAHVKARKLLLESCDLQGVISMPSGVFQPYSGVGTAVLVFVRGGKTEKVWFYDMRADGYSLDQRRDFIDGKSDIPDIIKQVKERTKASVQTVLVPVETIKKNSYNLSISRYKQVEHEEADYEDHSFLINQ